MTKDQKTNSEPAKRLRELLKQHKMTQKALADQIYVDPRYISMIVCGQRGLSNDLAQRIAACFPGTRVQWLLGFDNYQTDGDLYHHVYETGKKKSDLLDDLICELGYTVEYGYQDVHTEEDGTIVKSKPRVTITSPGGSIRYFPLLDEPESFSVGSYDHFKLTLMRVIEGQLLVLFSDSLEKYRRW